MCLVLCIRRIEANDPIAADEVFSIVAEINETYEYRNLAEIFRLEELQG